MSVAAQMLAIRVMVSVFLANHEMSEANDDAPALLARLQLAIKAAKVLLVPLVTSFRFTPFAESIARKQRPLQKHWQEGGYGRSAASELPRADCGCRDVQAS